MVMDGDGVSLCFELKSKPVNPSMPRSTENGVIGVIR